MPADDSTIDPVQARRLLATAAITISSFRWKLADAGHPFREPPGVAQLLREIDALIFPEAQYKRLPRPKRVPDPTTEQLQAARGLGLLGGER
jgi:hypothetical protein